MPETFSIYLHIFSLSLILLLLSIILANWKRTSYIESNRYLSLLLFVYSYAHINSIFVLNDLEIIFYYTRIINNLFTISVGPLIYLAVLKRYTFELNTGTEYYHFVPLIIFSLLYSVFFFDFEIDNYPDRTKMDNILMTFFLVQLLIYISLTWFKMNGLHPSIHIAFHFLLLGLFLICITQIVLSTILFFKPNFNYPKAPYLLNIFSSFLIIFVWQCIKDSELLFLKKKYKGSTISDRKLYEVLHKVQDIMTTKEFFLKKGLRIKDIGEEISEPPEYISQAVNSILNSNFNDFINNYRIKYFEELIESGEFDNYTLLGLAEKSGFRSSSAFNTAFKKTVGMLPSEFRKAKQ